MSHALHKWRYKKNHEKKINLYIKNRLLTLILPGGLRGPFYIFMENPPTLCCILFKIIQN